MKPQGRQAYRLGDEFRAYELSIDDASGFLQGGARLLGDHEALRVAGAGDSNSPTPAS
jgi:hypothetical protein